MIDFNSKEFVQTIDMIYDEQLSHITDSLVEFLPIYHGYRYLKTEVNLVVREIIDNLDQRLENFLDGKFQKLMSKFSEEDFLDDDREEKILELFAEVLEYVFEFLDSMTQDALIKIKERTIETITNTFGYFLTNEEMSFLEKYIEKNLPTFSYEKYKEIPIIKSKFLFFEWTDEEAMANKLEENMNKTLESFKGNISKWNKEIVSFFLEDIYPQFIEQAIERNRELAEDIFVKIK